MVAVLTAALVTAAEISSLFSVVGVVICLICMTVFIMRINGEDLFGTSVVLVAQPPVAQVSFQKVAVPFTLELHRASDTNYSDVQLKIKSDVAYIFRSYWGVMSDNLHSLMGGPWSNFCVDFMDNSPLDAEIIEDVLRYDETESHEYKKLGIDREPSSLNLGLSPRKKYPLVVCMLRQDQDEADPSTVGALITIIHIKDSDCQIPSCILHQYLKQYSGQLTRLQALYTQGNPNKNTNDEESNEEEDIPIEEACVVCQTNRITRALLPCRHVCVCRDCFGRLETCPMCRARFLSFFLVGPEPPQPEVESPNVEEQNPPSAWQRVINATNPLFW